MNRVAAGPETLQSPGKTPRQRTQQAAWFLSVVAVDLFLLLMAAVCLSGQLYFAWDLAVSRAVQSIHWPGMEALMHGVSLAGDQVLGSSVLVAAACLVLLALRARREAAALLGVVVIGQVLKIGIKQLVRRPRPSPDLVQVLILADEKYSFPSGHTVHYVVFLGFLWFLVLTRLNTPALRCPLLIVFGGMVLLVGLARIYLGAHWLSDVVGGYLLGGAVLAAGIGLYGRRASQATSSPGGNH
jgi:undecaprenyl-diphosphatase